MTPFIFIICIIGGLLLCGLLMWGMSKGMKWAELVDISEDPIPPEQAEYFSWNVVTVNEMSAVRPMGVGIKANRIILRPGFLLSLFMLPVTFPISSLRDMHQIKLMQWHLFAVSGTHVVIGFRLPVAQHIRMTMNEPNINNGNPLC